MLKMTFILLSWCIRSCKIKIPNLCRFLSSSLQAFVPFPFHCHMVTEGIAETYIKQTSTVKTTVTKLSFIQVLTNYTFWRNCDRCKHWLLVLVIILLACIVLMSVDIQGEENSTRYNVCTQLENIYDYVKSLNFRFVLCKIRTKLTSTSLSCSAGAKCGELLSFEGLITGCKSMLLASSLMLSSFISNCWQSVFIRSFTLLTLQRTNYFISLPMHKLRKILSLQVYGVTNKTHR